MRKTKLNKYNFQPQGKEDVRKQKRAVSIPGKMSQFIESIKQKQEHSEIEFWEIKNIMNLKQAKNDKYKVKEISIKLLKKKKERKI